MKVCFVVEDIYPTLNPSSGLLGTNGRAIHLTNLGRQLAEEGEDVSYVTMDYGQPSVERLSGVTVYKMYRPGEGIPGLRFFLNKVPKLLKQLKRADADLYIFMCPDPFVGIISWYCRRNAKKFIYYGGSDKDFSENSWGISGRDYLLFRYGLKNADLVLCQNDYQKAEAEKFYKIKGHVLYNAMKSAEHTYTPDGHIVWVANYRPLKRPEMFIKLSKMIDDTFVMVGGRSCGCSEKQFNAINEKAGNGNINIKGPRSYEESDRFIFGAKVLVSTSEFEGISNTFLQAWRRGIPVVSFVDPDNMIRDNGLGLVVDDFDGLVRAVEELRKGISRERSMKIKEFFDAKFSSSVVARRFREFIENMV